MERRCRFMEESVFFQQNTGLPYPVTDDDGRKVGQCNTAKWRSNVFDIMLQEVKHFCEPTISWSSGCHRQVRIIYYCNLPGSFSSCNCSSRNNMQTISVYICYSLFMMLVMVVAHLSYSVHIQKK